MFLSLPLQPFFLFWLLELRFGVGNAEEIDDIDGGCPGNTKSSLRSW